MESLSLYVYMMHIFYENLLSWDLNSASIGRCLRLTGNEFQSQGAAKLKQYVYYSPRSFWSCIFVQFVM